MNSELHDKAWNEYKEEAIKIYIEDNYNGETLEAFYHAAKAIQDNHDSCEILRAHNVCLKSIFEHIKNQETLSKSDKEVIQKITDAAAALLADGPGRVCLSHFNSDEFREMEPHLNLSRTNYEEAKKLIETFKTLHSWSVEDNENRYSANALGHFIDLDVTLSAAQSIAADLSPLPSVFIRYRREVEESIEQEAISYYGVLNVDKDEWISAYIDAQTKHGKNMKTQLLVYRQENND